MTMQQRFGRFGCLCLIAFGSFLASPVNAELVQLEREYSPFRFRSDIVEAVVLTLRPYDYATGANLVGQRQVELNLICTPTANENVDVTLMITSYEAEEMYNSASEWRLGFRGVPTGKGYFKIGTEVGADVDDANATFQVYRSLSMLSELGRYFDEFHISDRRTVYLSGFFEKEFMASILNKGSLIVFAKGSGDGRYMIESEFLYEIDDVARQEFNLRCNGENP